MRDYEGYIKSIRGDARKVDPVFGIESFARMATEGEAVSRLTRVSLDGGTIPPGVVLHQSDESTVFVDAEMNHVLVSGPTGSGKSTSVNGRTAHYWAKTRCPIVITDPKGELISLSAAVFQEEGYDVKVLYLKDPNRGIRFNPLAEIQRKLCTDDPRAREEGELELSDLFYGMIVQGTPSSDAYWSNNPWQFVCGLTKELIDRVGGDVEITIPMVKVAADMVVNSKESVDEFRMTLGDENPNKAEMLNMLSISSNDTRSGMTGYLHKGLSFCRSRGMMDMLSGNDLDIHDISAGKPVALFIVSPDDTNIYDALVSVILGQILHVLYSDADKVYGGALPREVLFILDEFANIPQIPAFEKIITTARSRRIRFMISVQSMSQIYSRYGTSADTIIDNCKDWVCTAGDPTFSGKLNGKIGPNAAGEDVVTINTLRCLPPGRPLMLMAGANPFVSTLFMVRRPEKEFEIETRKARRSGGLDLQGLVFHPRPHLPKHGYRGTGDLAVLKDAPEEEEELDRRDEPRRRTIEEAETDPDGFDFLEKCVTNRAGLTNGVAMFCI